MVFRRLGVLFEGKGGGGEAQCVQGRQDICTLASSCYLDGGFQLLGELLDAEEASLLEDAWKTWRTAPPNSVNGKCSCGGVSVCSQCEGNPCQMGALTSDVDALVDDELAVSQVVEDRLEVLGAAVDEVRPALVPRVPPNIWSDNTTVQLGRRQSAL